MKLNKNYIETTIFIILYLTALYLWTLPIRQNHAPYGEFDAMSHFEVADYMSGTDKSIVYLPPYIDIRYGVDNSYKPHTLWYYPPFHTSFAIMQIIGGERIVPVYLTNAIFATAIIISVYFVIRSLFGFLPAILSSLLLVFSPRDFLPYLWGQWPERLGYAFIPLILYCYYRYFTSYCDNEPKPAYIYVMSLLFAINMLIHPLVFFHSVFGLIVLAAFLAIKERKFPFSFKHVLVSAIIVIALFAIFPLQTGNVIVQFFQESSPAKSDFSRVFRWSFDPESFRGSVPPNYFYFNEMNGLWTMPFIFLGIIFLVLRRERRDLFLLAWLVSLYLVLHRDFFGSIIFLHRSLSASAHIFAPLTAIGMLYISSAFKIPRNYSTYLKYILVAVFVYLAISVNGKYAYPILKNAYAGIQRINPAQIEASGWLMQNLDENENVTLVGTLMFQKSRWIAAVSQRVINYFPEFSLNDPRFVNFLHNGHFMIDYSDQLLLNNIAAIEQLQAFESLALKNHTLLYDKDNIRIYNYGKTKT